MHTLVNIKKECTSLKQHFNPINKEKIQELKSQTLELLARLKQNQDLPENKIYEDEYEELIYEVIVLLGQLD